MADKILIVDDDLDTLRLVGLMLQRQGYEAVAASSGDQALSLAVQESPDLILLDVMMPGMDGVEVARLLRSTLLTQDIPVIMFTARSQQEDRLLGYEAGVDDYLTKPIQPRELFNRVKNVLSNRRRVRAAGNGKPIRSCVIGILAARGGVGVSTLALNLGIALREVHQQEVIVAELCPGQGMLGLEINHPDLGGLERLLHLQPIEITDAKMEAQLAQHSSGIRLLLASSQPGQDEHLKTDAGFEILVRRLPAMAPYIILDLGVGLPSRTQKILPFCDEVILVVDPTPQTLLRTQALAGEMVRFLRHENRVKIVLIDRISAGDQAAWETVSEQLGWPPCISFPCASALAYQASSRKIPLVLLEPDSIIAQKFRSLAAQFPLDP